MVVDASGQSGLLQQKFKLRVWDPVLNKGAIWTYWEDAYRDTGKDEGATIVLQTADSKGWFWYIPLHDNRSASAWWRRSTISSKARQSHEQTTRRKWSVSGDQGAGGERPSRHRLFCDADYSYRATGGRAMAGCWWATRSDSSIRSTPPAFCWL